MTVAGLIEQYNTERPNQVDDELKMNWLRKCEQMLVNEVFNTHEDVADLNPAKSVKFSVKGTTLKIDLAGKTESNLENFGMNTELMVHEPYDELYIFYLDQKIAYNNNDSKKYDRAVVQYNNALLTFQQYINRTYKPKTKPSRLFGHSGI